MRLSRVLVVVMVAGSFMVGAPVFAASHHHLAKTSMAGQTASSKVNINTADVAVLQTLSGVGEKKAKTIVAYREKNGKFVSVDDLAKVKGIGAKFLARLKTKNPGRITV